MTTYDHYYRCGCVNWASGVWVEEESNASIPGFHGKQHFQLERASATPVVKGRTNDSGCQRYLRFDHTEQIQQNHRKKLPVDDPGTGVALVLKDARNKAGPTIAVMWDAETSHWYHGSCRHEKSKTLDYVPSKFVDYVTKLTVDPSDWAFGWNCAEVECVIKAYAAGKTKQDLSDCFFVAYSVSKPQGIYGACRTCKSWIQHFGAKFLSPNR